MTNKELLYVEDALGHEQFIKKCCDKTSSQLQDATLSSYVAELAIKHDVLSKKFLDLL